MTQAVIAALGRSAIGRARKGSLVDVRPDDLAAYVVTKVLDQLPQLERSEIEDLICGCGLPGGEQGHNIGRVVSILSRLDAPGVTVNRYCSSSLMTTRMAANAIEAGEGDVFLSVGVECVSRYGSGYPDAPDTYNAKLVPGNTEEYPDIYIAMGQTAENVARREKISREEQDRFAVKSQDAAVKARDDGFFDREIIPVPLPNGETFSKDDSPRPGTNLEALAKLEPAFKEGGKVTAGNSCPLNDGAAAVVVMSDTRAKELGIKPIARFVSTGGSALEPEFMGLGPIEASRSALKRAGMTIDAVDILEINQAFAAQLSPSARALRVSPFDDTPTGSSGRPRVDESGGGAFVADGGTGWSSNFADQRLHRQTRGPAPRPITEAVDRRYADAIVDRKRGLLYAVREDHTDTSQEAVNTIVAIGIDGEREVVVVEGNDFYSDPRLSPDGTRLCWLAWNHPHLPWDGTELWVGTVAEDGSVGSSRIVAGGGEVSIFQPCCSPEGFIHCVSDESRRGDAKSPREARPCHSK